MKSKSFKTILVGIATSIFLSGQTSATQTDLWRLLGSSTLILNNREAVYQTKSGASVFNISIAIDSFMENNSKVLSITAFKFGGKMDKNELLIFGQNISSLAVKCFNIESSRTPSIINWISINTLREASPFQTSDIDSAQATFGPLRLLIFKRANQMNGQSITVALSRDGTPGEVPWVNSCVVSG